MLLKEVPGQCRHWVLGIEAADISGEHVCVWLLAPFGTVAVRTGDRNSRLLRILRSEEEKRTLRHDGKSLGVGLLHSGGDCRRARLVIDDERDDLVPVDTAFCVL